MKEGHDVIILTDDNINSLEDNTNTNMYHNIELKNLKDDMIIEHSLTIHNHEPTFFRKNIHSCIDHIISNCSLNISNVCTHVNNNDINYINNSSNIINNTNPIMSDHALLTSNYNNKDIVIPQQFKIIRDYKKLTKHNL